MNLSVGIVGLPNVGKSTLFNALLKKQQALAANYPFATIEPNVGIVAVPDPRLAILAKITKEEEKMANLPPLKPATVEFVDIAGLVKGASEGAGLGNKFLSHIREVQIIAHVVRAFEDSNVIREGSTDPKSDFEIINTELMLADVTTLQKALENRKIEQKKKVTIEKALAGINNGRPVYRQQLNDEEREELKDLFLLSNKQQIVVLNVSESQYNPEGIKKATEGYAHIIASESSRHAELDSASQQKIPDQVRDDDGNVVVICAQIESELASLSEEEQKEYLKGLGLEQSGLERLIQKAYQELGLISFLTAGEKEVRAWTIKKGTTAPLAAGEIHTDFIKKFIKAEVVGFEDFVGESGPARIATPARSAASAADWQSVAGGGEGSPGKSKATLEGKKYIVKDGDVVEFKIGA